MKPIWSAAFLAGALAPGLAPQMTANAQVGGPCAYDSYPGVCTIAAVAKNIGQKEIAGGAGYEGFDVSFAYAGAAPRANPLARQALERRHDLRLANGWRPGPLFLKKYAIAEGKAFACDLKIIRAGTCAPTIFQFPAIDQTDYFER
jgi:hypothetical protein